MKFVPFPPQPSLAPFVELIWVLQGTPTYRREKVLPNGVVEWIVNLGSPHRVVDAGDFARYRRFRRCWIAGFQEGPILIQAERESDLVGIRFRPGGAQAFLRAPLDAITNQLLECDEVFGRLADELRERLAEAPGAAAKARLAQEFLARRIQGASGPDPWVVHVVRGLTRPEFPAMVDELRRDSGLSHKTFTGRFRRAVGTTPKLFSRVHRFQGVIRDLAAATRLDGADLAARHGYFDQSHLIRDFREFAGAPPSVYLATRDADENHMIVD